MSELILFQGDSITDAGRERDKDDRMGRGYATLVSAELGYKYAPRFAFLNRGIGGNRIVDVYARIKKDIINLKPDYMSLLVGVNDVWHEVAFQNGADTKKFSMIYDLILDELLEALPDLKIMILGPYVMEGEATCATEERPDKWDFFREGVAEKAEASRLAAEKHGLVYIPLQERFDEAQKRAPAIYWSLDGVHPTAPGHEVIARAWVEAFEKNFIK